MSTNTSLSSIKERLQALTSKDLPISGGNGTSYEDAIVLDTPGEGMAMSLEGMVTRYLYPGQKKVRQTLAGQAGHKYDIILLDGPNGEHEVYFDITASYGHFGGPVFKDGKLVSY